MQEKYYSNLHLFFPGSCVTHFPGSWSEILHPLLGFWNVLKIRLRFQEFFVKVDFPEFWDRPLMNVIWGLNNFLEFWKKRILINMNSTEMQKTPDFLESYKSTNQNKSNIFLYIEVLTFSSFQIHSLISNDITNLKFLYFIVCPMNKNLFKKFMMEAWYKT